MDDMGDVAGSVDGLLSAARAGLTRLTPKEAHAELKNGAGLVDIRSMEQRRRDGLPADARVVPRNVLEWRLDPRSDHRDPELAQVGKRVILICDEGYQSSLVAATIRGFGIDATDVIGGFQAWRGEGLPIIRSPEAPGR
jgi:rhodanese-related sulfurtransferase